MDIHVRFWDAGKVISRYLTSAFLGHGRAEDLKKALLEEISKAHLQLGDLIQISMDGLSVNLKLHKLLSKDIQSVVRPAFHLLDIGTCNLHVVHNAFKAGYEASAWDIGSFLSSMFYFFKDTPARREDFTSITDCHLFPLENCPHRWLKNIAVAERALQIWLAVQKFIRHLQQSKNPPITKSFNNLVDFTKDPLLEAKVETFLSVARLLRPVLIKYQGEAPLLPYLAEDLASCLRSVLLRFVKSSVLSDCTSPHHLIQIDLDDDKNVVDLNKVDIGYKAKEHLKADKIISLKAVLGFRMQAKAFLKAVAQKIINKTALQSKLVRNLQWLNPKVLRDDPEKARKQLSVTLTILVSANRIEAEKVDDIMNQFDLWIGDKPNLQSDEQRLDTFFYSRLREHQNELWKVSRLLLTLSHGQAQVERGFSTNKEVMATNMKERTLVAKRVICDYISSVGGLENVKITPALLLAAGNARSRYRQALEEEKGQTARDKLKRKRDDALKELDELKAKKAKLEGEATILEESADRLAEKAETLKSHRFIVESNSHRRSAKDKRMWLSA